MKRLQCLYKPTKDKNYPWALKHPKVDSPLALFKTRQDAMNWFLALGYDCVTWFHTEDGIWGGSVLAEKLENQQHQVFEINVDKFDGGLKLQDAAQELFVDLETERRYENEAEKYLSTLNNFKIIKNHETYFPKDDVVKVKRSKKPEPETIVKVEKEVVVERVEVPVVKVVEEKAPSVEEVKYTYSAELCKMGQLKAFALYAKKLESVAQKYSSPVQTSSEDFKDIEANLEAAAKEFDKLESEFENTEHKHVYELVQKSLKKSMQTILSNVQEDASIAYSPATSLYFEEKCCSKTNLKLSQSTSYVLYGKHHVGFVPEADYSYAVFVKEAPKYSTNLVIFENEAPTKVVEKIVEVEKVVEVEKPVVVEKVVEKEGEKVVVKSGSWIWDWFAFMLLGIGYLILVVVILILIFSGNAI